MKKYRVDLFAVTVTCATFLCPVTDVMAMSPQEAGANAIAFALQNGLMVRFDLNAEPVRATPIFCQPVAIEEEDAAKERKVELYTAMPKGLPIA